MGGAILIKDLGGKVGGGWLLKRWGTCNSYYMIWVIVETTVSNNETPSHAD